MRLTHVVGSPAGSQPLCRGAAPPCHRGVLPAGSAHDRAAPQGLGAPDCLACAPRRVAAQGAFSAGRRVPAATPHQRLAPLTNAGKPRGYAFIEYEHKNDMKQAYKMADGRKIEGKRVLVDVERGRTVPNWQAPPFAACLLVCIISPSVQPQRNVRHSCCRRSRSQPAAAQAGPACSRALGP